MKLQTTLYGLSHKGKVGCKDEPMVTLMEFLKKIGAFLVLFVAFSAGNHSLYAAGQMEAAQEEREARRAYQLLLDAEDYKEASSLITIWETEMEARSKEYFYALLLEGMGSRNMLSLSTGPSTDATPIHDIYMQGGRCAWALETLLGITLPAVTRESKQTDISMTAEQVIRAIVSNRSKAVPELNLANMSTKERLALARVSTTSSGILAVLAGDSSSTIRLAVAENLNTPTSDLFRLMKDDKDKKVRDKAAKNLETIRWIK